MAKDTLARGAKSANFGSLQHIPQTKWDAAFADVKIEKSALKLKK